MGSEYVSYSDPMCGRNDITCNIYSPKIASTSETTDTFELRNPDNTVEGTESPQAITLCWALSFLALFDFLGGFHLRLLQSTVKAGFLYSEDLKCSSISFGVTQITCCPFQYFTRFRL